MSKLFTGNKILPYVLTFGAGMGAAHFWRAKSFGPQPRNRDDVAG